MKTFEKLLEKLSENNMKNLNNRQNKLIQIKPVKYFSKENLKLAQKIGRRADSKLDRRGIK
jgi:hypothetical protein